MYVSVEMHLTPRKPYSAEKLLSLQLNGAQSECIFAAVVE